MKNLTVAIALLLSTFSLFAQYDRKGLLVSTSLGFSKNDRIFENFNLGQPNVQLPTSTAKNTNLAFEMSYVTSEKFMIGLGYLSNKSENNNNSTQPVFNPSTGGNIPTTFTSINTNTISGLTLHMRYSQNVFSKCIFSLKFTYLNLNSETKAESFSTPTAPNNFGQSTTKGFSFSEARFSPSIHYFISKKFGCYIETLGLNLNFSDSRKVNKEIDYNFDLNPQTWRVGLFYFIPTSKAIE
jgi:hypothetical protein